MPGLISPSTLDQIRSASDIVDIIGAALPLKRAGANFVTLCPFHKEKSPSFNVNPHKQIFHCFGCHKGGDVFTFIREYENLSFMEAVQRLAERARIPLDFETSAQGGSRSQKDALLQVHEQITQRWQNALANEAGAEIARTYLAKRGVSAEAIKLFRLGYAPEAWDDTVNWGKSRGHPPELMEAAGLIIRKEETGRHYDRFRGRLMFPICDEQGRVIAFSGRVLAGDEKTAKYVNSPETEIFRKSKVFYGLDKSKRALIESERAVVCEGQLDLIACFMGGVQNVVAPQGTAFTGDHARILKRYVNEAVLCFDSDTAGHTAAVRVLDSLLASGLAVRVAAMPAPHDPDSYIKQFGAAAFQKLIAEAQGFFDYYLNRLCETNDLQSDKGRVAVLHAMAEGVQKTGNRVLVDTYAQKTAIRLGVATDAVRREFTRHAAAPSSRGSDSEESVEEGPNPVQPPTTQEFWLLKLALTAEDHLDWLAAHLDPAWIRHAVVRQILTARLLHVSQSSVAALITDETDPATRSLITQAAAEDRPIPNPFQQLQDLVLRLRNQALDQQITLMTQKLQDPSLADEVRVELLQRQQHLRMAKRQPLTALPDEVHTG